MSCGTEMEDQICYWEYRNGRADVLDCGRADERRVRETSMNGDRRTEELRISRTTAQRIVTDLSEIIQENINLMDENSVIIASTDPKRIGTFHAGSREVISKHLKELVITDEGEYSGSLPGLNIPIEVDGTIIGVIGITGQYQEIEKYGKIIKRMTEILVLEDWRKEQKRLSVSARVRFLNEWVFNENYCADPAFRQQARLLGIRTEIPRKVVIFSPEEEEQTDSAAQQDRTEQIERCLAEEGERSTDLLVFSTATKCICLLPNWSRGQMQRFVEEGRGRIEKRCRIRMGVGMDDTGSDSEQIFQAYRRAEKALRASLKANCVPIAYQDLTLEILLPELSMGGKREYIEKIFKNCPEQEQEKYAQLLKIYFSCNGSLKQTGERLFLHKNTIQYQLNKLKERTGLDPRKMEDAALLYLAVVLAEDCQT